MPHLVNIVSHAQKMLTEILQPGDLAVDLTAGNGSDTMFLAEIVGPTGRVIAFDIQEQALAVTAEKLKQAGVAVVRADNLEEPFAETGVTLVTASHESLSEYLDSPVKGIIANLGYLPGGDMNIVTRPESTVAALNHSTSALAIGGRLAVVVYPSHPGGAEESGAVNALFESLPLKRWNVLRIEVPNSSAAPYLLVAEKR
jgi:16S rRNA C1402 N4-methylase RsmH